MSGPVVPAKQHPGYRIPEGTGNLQPLSLLYPAQGPGLSQHQYRQRLLLRHRFAPGDRPRRRRLFPRLFARQMPPACACALLKWAVTSLTPQCKSKATFAVSRSAYSWTSGKRKWIFEGTSLGTPTPVFSVFADPPPRCWMC